VTSPIPAKRSRRAIHFDPKIILASCADLSYGEAPLGAIVESHKHAGKILALHRHWRAVNFVGIEKRLHVAQRLVADRHYCTQICKDGHYSQTSYMFRKIAPMRSYVGECAARPALVAVEPPRVGGLFDKPVLQISPMDETNGSDFLLGDAGPGFLHQGIAAISEGHRMDNAG